MWKWLRNLFVRRRREPDRLLHAPDPADSALLSPTPEGPDQAEDEYEEEEPPPWAMELGELLRSPQPPAWAADLAELVQKSSRAQGRLSLRLDELERKLEGGVEDLRQSIKTVGRSVNQTGGEQKGLRWDDLLDAMDILEEATAAAAREAPGVAEGLGGVQQRLLRFLGQGNLARIGATGTAPDGSLFRIVGTEQRPELPEGAITRVVRAAVKNGDRLVREGEVLTNRRVA